MKFRIPIWKNLALLAASMVALCLSPMGVRAQSTSQYLYLNTPFTVPAARYESPEPFWIYGGRIFTNGNKSLNTSRMDVNLADGSEFHGVNMTVTNANLRGRNILFKGGTIDISVCARLSFEDCIFDGVTFTLGSNTSFSTTTAEPSELFERYRGHLALKNSLLHKVQFQVRGTQNTVIGLKMEQCTVGGPGSLLPMLISRPGLLDDLRRAQTEMSGCTFTQCSYSSPFLAVTRDCVFDTCTLVPGLPLPEITTPLQLTASFHPIETSDQVAAQLPQYVITPPNAGLVPGCTLQYSIAGGDVSRNELPTLAPRTLAAVLPAAVQETSTTPGTIANTFPMTPGSPTMPGPPSMPIPRPSRDTSFTTSSLPLVEAQASPTDGAPDCGLKLQQANVHGLLIMSLGGGEAGSASKMGAIALKGYTGVSYVRFNQPVGTMMAKALEEVAKFTQINNNGWPQNYQIEISFADKYSNKDGPSAAVACALLLHSLITGKELDPAFAVTGDMNADGSVQPIGGVAAKIRGATKSHCKIIGIPAKNESSLGDLLLTDGPAPFASIQIFSLQHFREAEALAAMVKPEATQVTIAEMNRVQEVLIRNPGQMGAWLRNQHVIAKLQQVLKQSPNNLSAKYLLMYASGKVPTSLSLAGSLSAIDDTAGDLVASIKTNNGDSFDSIGAMSVGSILTRLQNLRARCDARARPYADAIIDFGTAVKEGLDRPAQNYPRMMEYRNKVNSAASSARSELTRLQNDPAVREELGD